jgi:hypothetical protein
MRTRTATVAAASTSDFNATGSLHEGKWRAQYINRKKITRLLHKYLTHELIYFQAIER